jgi:hypothetical protein
MLNYVFEHYAMKADGEADIQGDKEKRELLSNKYK